ncbi:MAG: 4Fe-4S protein [Firmicutes bacterium]|nr:4Fe-4S protein [Bacillota bacterium]
MVKHKYLKNVVSLNMNTEKCIGCGMCLEVCPHNVFRMDAGKACIQKRDSCMECGACVRNCPAEALNVNSGVGCAYAIIKGKLNGSAPCCGGTEDDKSPCCG